MKTLHIFFCATLSILVLNSCANKDKDVSTISPDKGNANVDSAKVNGISCDIEIAEIHFTKALNGADSLVNIVDSGRVEFRVGGKKDYFCDPNNQLSSNTAPILLTKVDNTKAFTFTAKVTPEFTEKGTYNAGVLYAYVNDNFWQKLCFEQDERGNHRIVTVRTIGTSDDNNHDIVNAPYAYMRISSDTRTIASYYSIDKKTWQMVRLYKNNYPSEMWLGISAQCPKEKGSLTCFEEISLEQNSVSDFRLGN